MNRLETVKELSLVRVVDDDLAHCSAMSFMLESKGWTVAAYEGEENFVGDSEIIALGGASNETKDRPLG